MQLGPIAKKAMNTLQHIYYNNGIGYPRVDNDFIVSRRHDLFPHPPMNRLNPLFMPLESSKYKVKKETAILFLTLTRLISPNSIDDTAQLIDTYLDDELNPISIEKENEINTMIKIAEEYFRENNLTLSQVLNLPYPFYKEVSSNSASGMLFFHVKNPIKRDPLFTRPSFNDAQKTKQSLLKSISMWDFNTEVQRRRKQKKEIEPIIEYKPLSFDEVSQGLERFKGIYQEKAALLDLELKIRNSANSLTKGFRELDELLSI